MRRGDLQTRSPVIWAQGCNTRSYNVSNRVTLPYDLVLKKHRHFDVTKNLKWYVTAPATAHGSTYAGVTTRRRWRCSTPNRMLLPVEALIGLVNAASLGSRS